MADVSWIKLCTDINSNRKIALLLSEKDGDTYFSVWVRLLCLAGECNMCGRLMIDENNPLSIEQLAKILNKKVKKTEEILTKFIQLRMIIIENNCVIIKNWSKYQSVDKLEEIRKSNRERQKKFRNKNKEDVTL